VPNQYFEDLFQPLPEPWPTVEDDPYHEMSPEVQDQWKEKLVSIIDRLGDGESNPNNEDLTKFCKVGLYEYIIDSLND